MLSIPDMALLGAAALLLFGPEQLPRVARKAGNVMRELQNTSQSFIREMERAADLQDAAETNAHEPPAYEPVPYDASAYDVTTSFEAVHANGTRDESPDGTVPADSEIAVGEKLAEPRSALEPPSREYEHGAEPFDPPPRSRGVL